MRRLTRAGVLLGSATVLSLGLAGTPAYAASDIISQADSVELANSLADAAEEQGVCYGWRIDLDDQSTYVYGSESAPEVGSNLGPGKDVEDDPTCEKWVRLDVDLTWTSESSEAEDSASASISSSFGSFTGVDLAEYGVTPKNLLGDNDDVTIIDGTSALPLIVADKGLAPPVPAEANTTAIPASDHATDSPVGPDTLRGNVFFWVVVVLVLLAIAYLVYLLTIGRQRRIEVPSTPAGAYAGLSEPYGGSGRPRSSGPSGPSGPSGRPGQDAPPDVASSGPAYRSDPTAPRFGPPPGAGPASTDPPSVPPSQDAPGPAAAPRPQPHRRDGDDDEQPPEQER